MRMIDIILDKRNGKELTDEQIQFVVDGVVDGSIPDYQISALLMAIYFENMTVKERASLTMKMMESGERLDLSDIPGIKVDKHSTGGVGDKVSLPLAALVAACDVPVPMISGRGLGHTGGTLDKLEAIPGYTIEISEKDFIDQVKEEKLAIVGATGDIAPADKKIYSLRDVTGTVDSIPLIAGSIMSKKIAAGADALIIDVKTGAGAFMKTLEDSTELAEALVEIGKSVGMKTMALISDMNQPLGNKIGNSLEIEETLDLLKGKGPEDLHELVMAIAEYMLVLGEKAQTKEEARQLLEDSITSGKALDRFKAMVKAQGGDERVVDDYSIMPQAKYKIDLPAKESGLITEMVADAIGITSMMLGGGRQKADDLLDYSVGIELHKKVGDQVEEGESILTIYSNSEDIDEVKQKLYDNIHIGDELIERPMIYKIIE
ncbi:pyrimidine-nucleoside phosphorylase [Dolosicoccus paucivorans]|uniref:Pyrimidine-nucleoside phosphorylase n=1 Tax=Dolosicoccus paucivorans TaxID=84521 RepID=A0A1G8L101_9LACT|nr:pyrimidine-nucleoside phosphorylase [Dolosicoccus paucivorans]PMB84033.1 pyrimidine-nucleoside phosphorylase [Dolosicoccus paucivorans]PMC58627.1 pyrimidine-nucleoside phosphorylase [Dolosicoccus paucivorans]SDI49358.1 thymidine phosphorylase [Dolosicoccus paucivorans]